MLYGFARILLNPLVKEFFSRVEVLGAPLLEDGPLLVVANHPNQMMDPLLVASSFRRPCWFLAKSTLFSLAPVAWVLRNLHMIPVFRKQDDPSQMHRNADSLAEAESILSRSCAVVIFPEGTSLGERRLAAIKTGSARIALQTEHANAFMLGLRIQAIGLTYSSFTDFQSSVTIAVSEPIEVREWRERFETDAQEAVRQLTAEIEQKLKSVSVEVPEKEHARLVERISLVARSFRSAHEPEPNDFQLMTRIASRVQALAPKNPELKVHVEDEISRYLALASSFGLEGSEPLESPKLTLPRLLRLILVASGALFHFIPYRFVGAIAARYEHDPVLVASAKFSHALWAYPAWYLLVATLTAYFLSSAACGLLLLLLLPLLGHYTNSHFTWARLMLISSLWPTKTKPIQILRQFRDELMHQLLELDNQASES